MFLCPFPLQVNQIHSFTGCLKGPQGTWDLWIIWHLKSCSHCPVHLHTKIRVSASKLITFWCFILFKLHLVFLLLCFGFFFGWWQHSDSDPSSFSGVQLFCFSFKSLFPLAKSSQKDRFVGFLPLQFVPDPAPVWLDPHVNADQRFKTF